MEVLEDPDEGNKPRGLVMEALEDHDVGMRPRGPAMKALEDPNQGSEVHSSYDYQKTVSFR